MSWLGRAGGGCHQDTRIVRGFGLTRLTRRVSAPPHPTPSHHTPPPPILPKRTATATMGVSPDIEHIGQRSCPAAGSGSCSYGPLSRAAVCIAFLTIGGKMHLNPGGALHRDFASRPLPDEILGQSVSRCDIPQYDGRLSPSGAATPTARVHPAPDPVTSRICLVGAVRRYSNNDWFCAAPQTVACMATWRSTGTTVDAYTHFLPTPEVTFWLVTCETFNFVIDMFLSLLYQRFNFFSDKTFLKGHWKIVQSPC